jgi:hypothetical protein
MWDVQSFTGQPVGFKTMLHRITMTQVYNEHFLAVQSSSSEVGETYWQNTLFSTTVTFSEL